MGVFRVSRPFARHRGLRRYCPSNEDLKREGPQPAPFVLRGAVAVTAATTALPLKNSLGCRLKHLIFAKPMWHARALACVSACTLLGSSWIWLVKQGLNCLRHPV